MIDDEDAFRKHYGHAVERGAALMLVAALDESIADAIKSQLVNDADVKDSMFSEMGPLGSFGARIRMAYLMGICTKGAYEDLKLINKIRNRFAHKGEDLRFSSPVIQGLCSGLKSTSVLRGSEDENMPSNTRANIEWFRKEGFKLDQTNFAFMASVIVLWIKFDRYAKQVPSPSSDTPI